MVNYITKHDRPGIKYESGRVLLQMKPEEAHNQDTIKAKWKNDFKLSLERKETIVCQVLNKSSMKKPEKHALSYLLPNAPNKFSFLQRRKTRPETQPLE